MQVCTHSCLVDWGDRQSFEQQLRRVSLRSLEFVNSPQQSVAASQCKNCDVVDVYREGSQYSKANMRVEETQPPPLCHVRFAIGSIHSANPENEKKINSNNKEK